MNEKKVKCYICGEAADATGFSKEAYPFLMHEDCAEKKYGKTEVAQHGRF